MIDCKYYKKCKKFDEGKCPFVDKDADSFCMKLFKISKLQDEALLTQEQRKDIVLRLDSSGVDRDSFNRLKEIEKSIDKFVEDGKNLYIYSKNKGNGKTSWALKLLNSYIEKIWYKAPVKCKCLFINVPNFLISSKDNFSKRQDNIEHIKENIFDADLVVWDDIATKGFTAFETELLLNYINGRISNGKANIYTSNLIGEELKESMGERLHSRVEHLSEVIVFRGVDKRGLV